MPTLLLMRHAKSSWKDDSLADQHRPLTGRGKKDALAMGDLLLRRGRAPDWIVTSPAKRARSTARRVAKAAGFQGQIVRDPRLYGGDLAAYRGVVDSVPDDAQTALLIGHNPTLEELIQYLTGSLTPMPTAAIAVVDLDRLFEHGRLLAVLDPRSVLSTAD